MCKLDFIVAEFCNVHYCQDLLDRVLAARADHHPHHRGRGRHQLHQPRRRQHPALQKVTGVPNIFCAVSNIFPRHQIAVPVPVVPPVHQHLLPGRRGAERGGGGGGGAALLHRGLHGRHGDGDPAPHLQQHPGHRLDSVGIYGGGGSIIIRNNWQ